MQPRDVGGYEWQESDRVARYLEREKEPEHEAEYRTAHQLMIELLPLGPDDSFRFLDLGAGAGAVSASVMAHFPTASGVLADMSAPMMQAGGEKLTPFAGRWGYVEYDMNSEDWPSEMAGPFQAAISARAIHHLTNERKLALFRRVFAALAPGGVFVNWDRLRDAADPRRPGNTHDETATTVDELLALLGQAGFAGASHSHRVGHRAIFFARKA
ncbi:MAG TPA: class I SAM-dependent methyltransferase [Chloroflexota bacterium]|jgi:cyclopropane fatty-acyl-phospholipid synthase-like methyltransferase